MNFKTVSANFLVYYKEYVKENTLYEYYNKINTINRYIENTDIEDINYILVNSVLNSVAKEKKLSKSTFNKYKIVINKILKYAYDTHLIDKSISLKNIKYPKYIRENKTILPLSTHQIKQITDYCYSENKLYPLLLLYTGMRRSEALALQVKDIDLSNNIIFVTKRLLFDKNTSYVENKLKNGDKLRTIPLTDVLMKVIKVSIKNKKMDDYIFINDNQTLFNKNYINRYWDKFIAEIGFKCNQHQLRHTYCTFLYQSGLDIKSIQRILGHKNINVTLNVYTNIDEYYNMRQIGNLKVFLDNNINQLIK